jgi:hypothetical protein
LLKVALLLQVLLLLLLLNRLQPGLQLHMGCLLPSLLRAPRLLPVLLGRLLQFPCNSKKPL